MPQEIMHHVLSYLSYSDVFRSIQKGCLDDASFRNSVYYDAQLLSTHPVELLNGYYFISHSDLLALTKTLQLSKNTANGSYHIGWSDALMVKPEDLPKLPSSISPYVASFAALSENRKLVEFNNNFCWGRLLFIYFSGIKQCINTISN